MVELMAPLRSAAIVDPGWEHGVAQDEKKKKVKCNYCGKVVSGGIYRLKQHLARVSGEVTYCDKAPDHVYLRMKENLEGSRSCKKAKQSQDDTHSYLNFPYDDDDEPVGFRSKGKQIIGDGNLVVSLTPRSLGYVDPGWEHGVAQDEKKKKVKCNYCEKVVSGGINRFKQHLARIPGEVASCKNAPEDVYLKMKDNMKWHRTGRRPRQPDSKPILGLCKLPDDEDDEEEDEVVENVMLHKGKERLLIGDKRLGKDLRLTYKGMTSSNGSEPLFKKSRLDSVFMNTPHSLTPSSCKQVKVRSKSSRKSRKEVISAICKFFYHAGVPLQAANSLYFHKMLELVGQYGQGLVSPQSQVMSGRALQEEIATIKSYLLEYKASWAITGCSIMADSWVNIEGRTLINLLVSCPHGVYFVASVDASDMLEDASSLFKLLDKVVEEMGEENVVQVITENTPTYKAAGKMLEEKRSNLFWTPCASSCIDQMLEDLLKIKCVSECMMKGQKITKLIYNCIWLLNLMKEFTQGQELLKPGTTRCTSSFATLQSLLDHKTSLKRMFQSSKWASSRFSKSDEGKEVEKIVASATFWKKAQHASKSVAPVMEVLQKVDSGELPSMPYIYNDMCRAKLAIKSVHGDDGRKYGPFWSVLEKHWNSWLLHPLYMAAYFLNPSYRYRSDFLATSEVMRGLNECIHRLEPENMRQISASKQISEYNSAKGDFGTELAISTRIELDPAAWWQQHGISCLELQRIAVRLLSQTCSSFACEHSWSIYDHIHSQRHNRFAQKRSEDLVFVHYNLRLRECQLKKRWGSSTSVDGPLPERLLSDWILGTEKNSFQEDEECFHNENGGTYEERCENDYIDYQDGFQRGSLELMDMADMEPLDINPSGSTEDEEEEEEEEDDDHHFFDDNTSD
ncbi:hAT transposon superfamily [Euphorbia peplus]|nr:hAT transposon superfamily [Euphorbia peplus]